MSKILDTEFRNGLYKGLIEIGYDKAEAQKIVGAKYYIALKESVNEQIKEIQDKVNNDDVDFTVDPTKINEGLAELKKMKKILGI